MLRVALALTALVCAVVAVDPVAYYGGCYETARFCHSVVECPTLQRQWVEYVTDDVDVGSLPLTNGHPYCREGYCLNSEIVCQRGEDTHQPFLSMLQCYSDFRTTDGYCNKYVEYARKQTELQVAALALEYWGSTITG
eukprot:CAMPEP_0119127432 /NCGR_PEP_ID=MMETSP1310-20130426/5990_1 /TAXON_ID=464262 /ORGANISM="Genus nov. species nov., Strain RCC2339" /LENGTH=137 /DNA_ID=CAMNT_0007117691 /DNA_START=62 /DNA_END=475 /DNA_ORIENTATION=+